MLVQRCIQKNGFVLYQFTSTTPVLTNDPGRRTAHGIADAASPAILKLLGAFQLIVADGTLVTPGKPLALLAFLACARNHRATRGLVADLLWSDSSETQRRGSLRQALFTLRLHLGQEALVSDGEWLELIVPLAVDSDEFVRAVEARDYRKAARAYAGDFIPNFAAPGAAEFERWADTERLRLRGAFVAAGVQHLRALVNDGALDEALDLSQRLVGAAPEDDEMWRRRLDVLSLAGRPGEVLLEVSTLRAQRAVDGRALDAPLEQYIGRLVGTTAPEKSLQEPTPADDIPASPEFQGRSEVFTTLLAAWARAASGVPQRLLVIGSAGTGKTRLLQELERRMRPRRVQVVAVAARQRERDDSYALLADIVARLAALPGAAGVAPSTAAVLAGLVPRLADDFSVATISSPKDESDALVVRAHALVDLLTTVADESPLLILIDDLHWADVRSVGVLERALARVVKAPLLVIASSRHASPDLGSGEAHVTIGPLTVSDLSALMASIAEPERGKEFTHIVELLHVACGGTPFAALRLLRAALDAQLLRIVEGRWQFAGIDGFERLLENAAQPSGRLGRADADSLEILMLLELADGGIGVPIFQAVLSHADEVINERLANLEKLGLVVRNASGQWTLAHALVAEDVRAICDDAVRVRLARMLGAQFALDVTCLSSLRRALRLLIEGGSIAAARSLALRWYSGQKVMPFTPELFIESIRSVGGDDAFYRALYRAIRWRRSWWRKPPIVAAMAAVATSAVALFLAFQPDRVVNVSSMDIAAMLDPEYPYEVAPRFEIRNRLGLVSKWKDGDTARIQLVNRTHALRGRDFTVIRDGVAEFDSLYPPTNNHRGPVNVTVRGLRPLAIAMPFAQQELRIVSGVVNGVRFRDSLPTIRVRRGTTVVGALQLQYSTVSRDIVYALAQTHTWGSPERDTLTVRTLLAGVQNARMTTPFLVPAPSKDGDYWILWTQTSEPTSTWILSGTNWRCGKPKWGDGNDLAAQPDSALLRAVAQQFIVLPFKYCRYQGSYVERRILPLVGLRIKVSEQ